MPRGSGQQRKNRKNSQEVEESSEEESSSEEEEESSSSDSDSSSDEEEEEEEEYNEDEDEKWDEEGEDGDYGEETLESLMDTVMDYDDAEEGWEAVREWLRTHSIDETTSAAEFKGEYSTTALHVACRNVPPVDVVDILLMASPDMIYWADSFGWLPLHYACANGGSADVMRVLIEANPDGKMTTDKRGRTPLHFALGNVDVPSSCEAVKLLCDAANVDGAAKWPDENQMLPIHYACAYGATVDTLEVLVDAWEESTTHTDSKGRTPLHFAMGNADRPNSPSVVELLVKRAASTINATDAEGKLPIHLLSTKADQLGEEKEEQRDKVKKCLDWYICAKPKVSISFLTAIQYAPEWIKDMAVLHPTVQTMLNSKISSRFPTMILMLDFYFLVMILAAFSYASLQNITQRVNPLNDTNAMQSVSFALLSPMYFGAMYFLVREIAESVSVRAQTTMFTYLCDPENVLNLSFVALTTYNAILMHTGLGDEDWFRTGASFTIGVCSFQVLAYFKSILIDFAVFVSGTIYILKNLVTFMISLFITVFCFAQMWYTLFRKSNYCMNVLSEEGGNDDGGGDGQVFDDAFDAVDEINSCEPSKDDPFCESLFWSFYRVYTMMLGETDENQFRFPDDDPLVSFFALGLFIIFFLLVVVLMLNILIAIITDLYGVMTSEKASIVFWSNRLGFITQMDLITNGPWKDNVKRFFRIERDEDEDDKEPISWERIAWKKLIECFDPEVDNSGPGMFLYFTIRIFISLFLIPFWLFLGILSAGWLWAPQVREGLFVQKLSVAEDAGEAGDIENRIESVGDLRGKLTTFQTELIGDFLNNQNHVQELKLQVKGIKKELKGEMKNIKQVMTSLFEVQQQVIMTGRG